MVSRVIRNKLTGARRRARWALAHRRLVEELSTLATDPGDQLDQAQAKLLLDLWANPDMASEPDYLIDVSLQCHAADGPVLECGTGVSTFIAAIYSAHGVWCLEQHLPSRRRAARIVNAAGLAARVIDAPLQNYGGFDWYRVPEGLPSRFAVAICDGPPGRTRGGRYGLLPVMRDRLRDGVVLLDDVNRESEHAIMERWRDEFDVELVDGVGRYAVLQVAGGQ